MRHPFRLAALAVAVAALSPGAFAGFGHLDDGRHVLATVGVLDYTTGIEYGGNDQRSPLDMGPWDASAHFDVTTPIGSGHADAHLISEGMSSTRLAGSATLNGLVSALNSKMYVSVGGEARMVVAFDLDSPTKIDITASLTGTGAQVAIRDYGIAFYPYARYGQNDTTINISDSITLDAGRYILYAGTGGIHFLDGQVGVVGVNNSATWAVTTAPAPGSVGVACIAAGMLRRRQRSETNNSR